MLNRILQSALVVSLCLLGAGAQASVPAVPDAVKAALPGCACDVDAQPLTDARREIAGAPTLEAARERALEGTRLAERALATARLLAPRSEALTQARDRIDAYQDRVAAADTPEEVAWEFGEFVQLASLDGAVGGDLGVGVDTDGCDLTTGEIVAVVIGFLLGILPGIILLIILC